MERGLTRRDFLVIGFLLLLAMGIAIPMLGRARVEARRIQCRRNLQAILQTMHLYAQSNMNNGYFPTRGSVADPFADPQPLNSLVLLYRQYVPDPKCFSCPENRASIAALPVEVELRDGVEVWAFRMTAEQCSYAYDPGHTMNDAETAVIGDARAHVFGSFNTRVIGFGSGSADSYEQARSAKDSDFFSRNPEIPRQSDGFLRQ